MKKRLLSPLFCALSAMSAAIVPIAAYEAAAQNPVATLPKGVQYTTSVEGIHEYRLANGMRVLLFPDASQQTAVVNITYRVGSKHEGYGETGMAHLLEHLLFKGSTNHTNIYDELTSHGTRPNGTTWFDRTNYFETFPATEENIDWALDLEADRMVNSFIAKKDLDSEMSVVRNEFEIDENDPTSIVVERMYSTAFLWHNYGKSTIGARSDIENVPIERLQAFYRTWYRPENAILVVAGRFDPAATLQKIQMKYGPIPNPKTPLPATYTTEPAQDGERQVILRRVGDIQVAAAAWHIPAASHTDYPALEILADILGDEPSGRLHRALVETKKATSVSGNADRFEDAALFLARAEVRKGQPLESVHDELVTICESLATKPVAQEDVDRARASILRGWETTLRNTSRAAINLSEWSAMGDWRLMFIHRDRLKAVTVEDVNRVAAAYLVAANRTDGLFIPTDAPTRVEIPARPDVPALVENYQGGEALAAGEDFDASPENIESRTTRFALPNGLKVSLLPKKTRGETVNLAVQLHFGTESTLKGKAYIADLAGDMLMRGTTTKTRQAIQDEVNRLSARFNVGGGATWASGSVEVKKENLPDAVKLLADVLKNPVFDAAEFDQLKEETISSLEEQKTDPRSLASTELNRYMMPFPADDVRHVGTPDEDIAAYKAVTPDQIRAFHQAFYGAGNGELAIVGDFDAPALKELLTGLFGDWKGTEPYARIVTELPAPPSILKAIPVADKESAVFSARQNLAMADTDPDYPALVLGNFMTGGGFLNSRLATRIRGKDGLSYGVGSRFTASSWDKNGSFSTFAIYAPQNDGKLLKAFHEEINLVLEKGFTPDEVTDAKSGWLQRQKLARSGDAQLVQSLVEADQKGRTMLWDRDLEARIEALTPEQIHAVMKSRIDPKQISIVRAGDFERTKKDDKDSSEKVN